MECFPGGSDGKESTCHVGHLGLIPGLGRSPGGGHGNPLQYPSLENPHGQRSLVGYSLLGRKELDMSEQLNTRTYPWNHTTWSLVAGFLTWHNVFAVAAAAAAKLLKSCPTLCDPTDGSYQATLSLGLPRQEHWSGLPFPSPMHESKN